MKSGEAIESEMECEDDEDIACKIGAAKYNAAAKLCETKVTDECRENFSFSKLQYSQNIRSDCTAYQNAIKDAREKGAVAAAAARKEMRETAAEQFEAKNKYNESECLIELKTCMKGPDICGEDWTRCNPDNVSKKIYFCEKILANCAAVRESVQDGFVAEITPTLKFAALAADDSKRQSCLNKVSDCVLNACQDNITGQGETMDACLARPDMARSFCKVELDECDSDGTIWPFVKRKLAAMRVDACTDEVKECFTDEVRCGEDWINCIGLDFETTLQMCPVEKLVVCKQANPDFSIADISEMVSGIFLNMEDQLMKKCWELIDERIMEVCQSQETCVEAFKHDNASHFEGEMDWGNVSIADGVEWQTCKERNSAASCNKYKQAGTILVEESVKRQGTLTSIDKDKVRVMLQSAQSKIDAAIAMIEDDPKVSWCIDGRDMKQIGGNRNQMARFPTITQGIRRIIAQSGIKQFSTK
jgi:hypothetical protein